MWRTLVQVGVYTSNPGCYAALSQRCQHSWLEERGTDLPGDNCCFSVNNVSVENPMKMRKWLLPAVALTALQNHTANAGGFALIEQGGSGMGNAYAGASAVSADASTVWFNPAGMMELQKPQLAVAGHILAVSTEFDNRGTTLNPLFGLGPVQGVETSEAAGNSFIPNFYYVRPLRDDLTFGFGFSVPFGNSTDYGRDWVGRYQAVESAVTVLDLNPSIAYRVNDKFSIGAGISLQQFEVTLGSSIDSGAVCLGLAQSGAVPLATCANNGLTTPGNQASDSYAEIGGDSMGVTFNVGLLFKPRTGTKLGFAFRSGVDHDLEGSADFTVNEGLASILGQQIPILQDVAATADASLPASTMLSVSHQANDKLELLADATFTNWSVLEELRVVFDNPNQDDSVSTLDYEDVWRISAGFNYQQSDKLLLRGGVAFDQDPVPSAQRRTPRIPGNDRTWLAFGLNYQIDNNKSVDFGYAHLFIDDTPIDNISESAGGITIRGVYEGSADLVSAQFNYKFK